MSLRENVLKKSLPPPGTSSKKLAGGRSFTPLQWNEFFDEERQISVGTSIFNVYLKGSEGPILYFLHGGGYSGLTWSCLVAALCERITCRVVCPDLRGHGKTRTDNDYALSKDQQIQDISDIFTAIYGNDVGPVCVIGHSMGGALAVHLVASQNIRNVVGLVVIDVVEGSAMDALSGMITFLKHRPSKFRSEEEAIKWCLQSGTAKTSKSARISMPSQIKPTDDGQFVWRIDLTQTASHWEGWFKGLSTAFVSCAPPKLLVLAGVDRLDKDLTIAQMQGKFQTTVLPRVGHAVHEDSPDRLAEELARFAIRYRFAVATNNAQSTRGIDSMRAILHGNVF